MKCVLKYSCAIRIQAQIRGHLIRKNIVHRTQMDCLKVCDYVWNQVLNHNICCEVKHIDELRNSIFGIGNVDHKAHLLGFPSKKLRGCIKHRSYTSKSQSLMSSIRSTEQTPQLSETKENHHFQNEIKHTLVDNDLKVKKCNRKLHLKMQSHNNENLVRKENEPSFRNFYEPKQGEESSNTMNSQLQNLLSFQFDKAYSYTGLAIEAEAFERKTTLNIKDLQHELHLTQSKLKNRIISLQTSMTKSKTST